MPHRRTLSRGTTAYFHLTSCRTADEEHGLLVVGVVLAVNDKDAACSHEESSTPWTEKHQTAELDILYWHADCALQHQEWFLLRTIHVEDFVRIVYERWGENQFILMC